MLIPSRGRLYLGVFAMDERFLRSSPCRRSVFIGVHGFSFHFSTVAKRRLKISFTLIPCIFSSQDLPGEATTCYHLLICFLCAEFYENELSIPSRSLSRLRDQKEVNPKILQIFKNLHIGISS